MKFNVGKVKLAPSTIIRAGSTGLTYYLEQKELFVDIWDGDTMFHIGQAKTPLWKSLRQGKEAVEFEAHVDIISVNVRLKLTSIQKRPFLRRNHLREILLIKATNLLCLGVYI